MCLFKKSAHMFKETAADLAEVGLLLVELFLQAFQKSPLESVDLFYVAKDCTDMLFREHICPLTTLFDVTLSKTRRIKRVRTHRTSIHIGPSSFTNCACALHTNGTFRLTIEPSMYEFGLWRILCLITYNIARFDIIFLWMMYNTFSGLISFYHQI